MPGTSVLKSGGAGILIRNLSNRENAASMPQPISYSKIGDAASSSSTTSTSHLQHTVSSSSNGGGFSMPPVEFMTSKPIFHKLVTYKTWSNLFDSMNHHICMLGVKLNLAKPPKHAQMIANYIDSARQKVKIFFLS